MIRFSVENIPSIEKLLDYVWKQMNQLKRVLDTIMAGEKEVYFQAPAAPSVGMQVYADGTSWNPGFGEGTYEYKNGLWNPLFEPKLGTVLSRTTVTNTTASTELMTVNLPAVIFREGLVIRFSASGLYSNASSSDDWNLEYRIDGGIIHTLSRIAANVTNEAWSAVWEGTIRTTGVSGTFADSAILHDDGTTYVTGQEHTGFDTTTTKVASLNVKWANAKVGNIFHIDQGFIEFLC